MADKRQAMIMIVEDDQVIAELLAYNLKEAGYIARICAEGTGLFHLLEQDPTMIPDLFILDLMLPGMDGYEICLKLRQMQRFDLVPIMMLTARSSESDKVLGLDSGADDYLTKPFGMRELQARVQALLRRYFKTIKHSDPAVLGDDAAVSDAQQTTHLQLPAEQAGLYRCRDLLLDDIRHRVYKAGQEIDMTHREYELLKFLLIHRGVAFSRDDLLNQVWGFEYGGETRTVDVHIRQLRRKLEDDAAMPTLIETVRGHGYRFSDQIK